MNLTRPKLKLWYSTHINCITLSTQLSYFIYEYPNCCICCSRNNLSVSIKNRCFFRLIIFIITPSRHVTVVGVSSLLCYAVIANRRLTNSQLGDSPVKISWLLDRKKVHCIRHNNYYIVTYKTHSGKMWPPVADERDWSLSVGNETFAGWRPGNERDNNVVVTVRVCRRRGIGDGRAATTAEWPHRSGRDLFRGRSRRSHHGWPLCGGTGWSAPHYCLFRILADIRRAPGESGTKNLEAFASYWILVVLSQIAVFREFNSTYSF